MCCRAGDRSALPPHIPVPSLLCAIAAAMPRKCEKAMTKPSKRNKITPKCVVSTQGSSDHTDTHPDLSLPPLPNADPATTIPQRGGKGSPALPRGKPGDRDKWRLKWPECCGCSKEQQAAHQQPGSGMQREQPLTFLNPPEPRSAAFPNTQHVPTAHTERRDTPSETNSCACEHISHENTEIAAASRSLSRHVYSPLENPTDCSVSKDSRSTPETQSPPYAMPLYLALRTHRVSNTQLKPPNTKANKCFSGRVTDTKTDFQG